MIEHYAATRHIILYFVTSVEIVKLKSPAVPAVASRNCFVSRYVQFNRKFK